MARIFIDVSAMSLDWFKGALPTLSKNKNVRFLHSKNNKYMKELECVPALIKLLNFMKQIDRRDDADEKTCETMFAKLEKNQNWIKEKSCDDPHIFSMIFAVPTSYVFTADKRIAKCRTCLSSNGTKECCSFKIICDKKTYEKLRPKIFR